MTVTEMFADKQIREALEYLIERGVTYADYHRYCLHMEEAERADAEHDCGEDTCVCVR